MVGAGLPQLASGSALRRRRRQTSFAMQEGPLSFIGRFIWLLKACASYSKSCEVLIAMVFFCACELFKVLAPALAIGLNLCYVIVAWISQTITKVLMCASVRNPAYTDVRCTPFCVIQSRLEPKTLCPLVFLLYL